MAEPLLDVAAQRQVQTLVKKITDKRAFSLEPGLLRDVKGMCRADDANVRTAFDAISEALQATHAQTRLLAVELADVLFRRSRVFRGLLAPRLAAFLVNSVGYRADAPLPGPADAAGALRRRALEALEGWDQQFGSMYHQVGLGVNYLKNTLKYQFPEVASRAAAEAARQTAAANEAFARIREGFAGGMADMASTLQQLEEAMALAEAPAAAAVAEAADGMVWADARAGAASGGQSASDDEEGGLAAYADEGPAEAAATASDAAAATAQAVEVDAALAETAVGLQRLLTGRHLPTLRRWLDVFARADPGAAGGPERAARDAMLRDALQRRAAIDGALANLGAARVRVPALGAAMDAAEAARAPAVAGAAAAAAAGSGSAGRGSTDAVAGEAAPEDDAELLASARRHAALRDPAAPASPWTLDSRFAGKAAKALSPAKQLARQAALQGKVAGAAGAAAAEGQTAASPLRSASPAAVAGAVVASGGAPGGGAGGSVRGRPDSKAPLPSSVKRRLLQSAPVIAGGGHLSYWDSGSGNAVAARSGMEIQNHWGAVDHDTSVSLAQLENMAVNHVPEYYRPAAAKPVPAAAAAPAVDAGSRDAAGGEAPAPQPAVPRHPGVTRIGGSKVTRIGSGVASISRVGAEAPAAEALPGSHGSSSAADAAATRLRRLVADSQAAAGNALTAGSGEPEVGAALRSTPAGGATPATPSGERGRAAPAGPEAGHNGTHPAAAGTPAAGGRKPSAVLRSRQNAAPPGAPDETAVTAAVSMATALDRRTARAHNDAVLAGAQTDEAAAAAAAEGAGAEGDKKRKRGGKDSVLGRLKKKLAAAESRKEPKNSIPGKDMVWIR